MAENKYEEAPLPNEARQLVINGKRYHSATANLCQSCSADKRYLFVKLKLASGDVVLECPVCDSTYTVASSMVRYNLNHPA